MHSLDFCLKYIFLEKRTFTGYATRYLRPEITSSWQYTLQQKPILDQYGQRPVPANIL